MSASSLCFSRGLVVVLLCAVCCAACNGGAQPPRTSVPVPTAVTPPTPFTALSANVNVQLVSWSIVRDDVTLDIVNAGSEPVDLTGWHLRVDNRALALPSATMPVNQVMTLHLSSGLTTGRDLFLGDPATGAVAVGAGTRLTLVDRAGTIAVQLVFPTLSNT